MNNSLANNKMTAKKQPLKFTFNDFDFSETNEDVQSITPKQLSKQVAWAKKTAFQEGYQKGVHDTNLDIARIAASQLSVLAKKLDELIRTEKEILTTFHQEVSQLTDLVTSHVLPTLSQMGAKEEVLKILEETLAKVPKEDAIVVTVHPDLVAQINAHMHTLIDQGQFEGQITVNANPDFDYIDCRVAWAGTGIERYIQTCMTETHSALMRIAKTPLKFSPPNTSDPTEDADTQAKPNNLKDPAETTEPNDTL